MRRHAINGGGSLTALGSQPLVSAEAASAGRDQALSAAVYVSSAPRSASSSGGAVWRTRIHRLYLRLNVLEQLLVQLLRAVHLWPALLQPPVTDAVREEMERAATIMATPPQSQAQAQAQSAAGLLSWSRSLLHSASSCLFPNGWHPLSFRKTVVIVRTPHCAHSDEHSHAATPVHVACHAPVCPCPYSATHHSFDCVVMFCVCVSGVVAGGVVSGREHAVADGRVRRPARAPCAAQHLLAALKCSLQ